MTSHFLKRAALAALALVASAGAALAVDISGAGATFPYPIYAKWAEAYKAATGATPSRLTTGTMPPMI